MIKPLIRIFDYSGRLAKPGDRWYGSTVGHQVEICGKDWHVYELDKEEPYVEIVIKRPEPLVGVLAGGDAI
jgi:hypothetical protein